MKKTINIVLYLNCIGVGIESCLNKFYPDHFRIEYIKNFKLINEEKSMTLTENVVSILQEADYFIYQPLSEYKYGGLSTEYIISRVLPRHCKCISFAYIYFNGYWPDGISVRDNAEISYGHASIDKLDSLDCVEKTIKTSKIIHDDIKGQSQYSIYTLQSKERNCDIRLAGDLESYYRQVQLFWTINHPTNFLFQLLLDRLLPCLGLNPVDISKEGEYMLLQKNDPIMPIYSQVKETLGLRFEPHKGKLRGEIMDDVDYYSKYWSLIKN